ncbi:class I tRNA ligase family protein [Catenulispora pinisilvae]|uniref:class I tRNA ligase family protein n=1 Tax=Catenulispora pinisilvae TaxID=2705253 RepID=UPI001892528A|nr:class I tRNA ligase family protein [Catenulispora pinisilvae]
MQYSVPARTGVKLVISPQPTPNGPLHVGHLSGPFLAADLAARAARAAGEDVVYFCGLDPHQNYSLARADQLGMPVPDMLKVFGDRIHRAMELAGFDFDLFSDPTTDADYRAAVPELLTGLLASGAVQEKETPVALCSACKRTLHHVRVTGSCGICGEGAAGGCCEGCGGFTSALNLVDPISSCCDAPAEFTTAVLPVLILEDLREPLREAWLTEQLPAWVRQVLDHYLRAGLPEIPMAYETDWGLPWRGSSGAQLRIDVWCELGLGYLYTIARHLRPGVQASPAACAAAWEAISEVWHFLGMDNSFYNAVLVPAVLAAAGVSPAKHAGIISNQFYRLDGLKFSTSRDHAIWADEFLAAEDPAVVRAYLAWDRPDHHGTDFTTASFEAFKEHLGAVLDGSAAGAYRAGSPLAELDAERGLRALRLESFDPPLAVRCALAAYPSGGESARVLMSCITGTEH